VNQLSVVLISKNQEWNIGRLIESVLRETSGLRLSEVVLVDSASTDGTTELAGNYPVQVLRLRPDQRLTPAAGRYVGWKHCRGDLILFLDGDMQLSQGYLHRALALLRAMPEAGVVTGKIINLPTSASSQPAPPPLGTGASTEVPYCAGAALYARSALERAGSFNPFLYSDEEPELCIRIRHAGFKVLKLDWPIAWHYSDPDEAVSTLIARWRRNLYLGAGQSIRYHLGTPVLWSYLKERGFSLLPGMYLLAGMVAAWWAITGRRVPLLLWLGLLLATIAADAIRKRSLHRTVVSLVKRLLILDGTIRGFLLKPVNPESYPAKLDVVPASTRAAG
jgi:glycosyltransferase involved in cell wall biosynthesis